jgi:hypothetical protein
MIVELVVKPRTRKKGQTASVQRIMLTTRVYYLSSLESEKIYGTPKEFRKTTSFKPSRGVFSLDSSLYSYPVATTIGIPYLFREQNKFKESLDYRIIVPIRNTSKPYLRRIAWKQITIKFSIPYLSGILNTFFSRVESNPSITVVARS